jgi:hypothetical protein
VPRPLTYPATHILTLIAGVPCPKC